MCSFGGLPDEALVAVEGEEGKGSWPGRNTESGVVETEEFAFVGWEGTGNQHLAVFLERDQAVVE